MFMPPPERSGGYLNIQLVIDTLATWFDSPTMDFRHITNRYKTLVDLAVNPPGTRVPAYAIFRDMGDSPLDDQRTVWLWRRQSLAGCPSRCDKYLLRHGPLGDASRDGRRRLALVARPSAR